MKKFSEINIKKDSDEKFFDCNQASINDVINQEIIILDYVPHIKTMHGDDRYIIEYKTNDKINKFFTSCKNIKNNLDKIEKSDFPFITIIKTFQYKNKRIYKFT